ncbi:MAG: LysR family transcriptional regulator [Lachnospiraceae bacterium]|nr:LysR family transcriptional regulator [Lachnospiraceae bacterium]
MDIKYLNEFRVLADVCNYQEAADHLFISLSALSKHISKLEQELGVSLFNRTTRKVSLSEYGSLFYRYAVQITDSYSDCTRAMTELQEDHALHLKVAFQPLLTEYNISEALGGFKQAYPDIQLTIMEHTNPRELLQTNQCDTAFHTEYGDRRDIKHAIFLAADELVAVLPADHPLAEKDSVSMEQLKEEKFIVKQETYSDLNRIFQQLCADAGFEPKVGCTIRYSSGMAKMVTAGMGIAVTNRKHVPVSDFGQIRAVPISPAVPFNIYLLYAGNRKNSFALQSFRDYLAETTLS